MKRQASSYNYDNSRVFKDLNKNIKRKMFNDKQVGGTAVMQDAASEMIWDLDTDNGLLSYTKMKYVQNKR